MEQNKSPNSILLWFSALVDVVAAIVVVVTLSTGADISHARQIIINYLIIS